MGKGRTMGITLPIEIIEKLGWKEHQKVSVKLQGSKLIIEDWKK